LSCTVCRCPSDVCSDDPSRAPFPGFPSLPAPGPGSKRSRNSLSPLADLSASIALSEVLLPNSRTLPRTAGSSSRRLPLSFPTCVGLPSDTATFLFRLTQNCLRVDALSCENFSPRSWIPPTRPRGGLSQSRSALPSIAGVFSRSTSEFSAVRLSCPSLRLPPRYQSSRTRRTFFVARHVCKANA